MWGKKKVIQVKDDDLKIYTWFKCLKGRTTVKSPTINPWKLIVPTTFFAKLLVKFYMCLVEARCRTIQFYLFLIAQKYQTLMGNSWILYIYFVFFSNHENSWVIPFLFAIPSLKIEGISCSKQDPFHLLVQLSGSKVSVVFWRSDGKRQIRRACVQIEYWRMFCIVSLSLIKKKALNKYLFLLYFFALVPFHSLIQH